MSDLETPNPLILSYQDALGNNKNAKKSKKYPECPDHLTRKNSLPDVELGLKENEAKLTIENYKLNAWVDIWDKL